MTTKNKKALYRQVPEEFDAEKIAAKESVLDDLKNRERAHNATPAKEEKQESVSQQQVKYPWEEDNVNERVIKAYNIRLKEPEFEKLKYVVRHSTEKSINSYVVKVLMREVEKDLNKI